MLDRHGWNSYWVYWGEQCSVDSHCTKAVRWAQHGVASTAITLQFISTKLPIKDKILFGLFFWRRLLILWPAGCWAIWFSDVLVQGRRTSLVMYSTRRVMMKLEMKKFTPSFAPFQGVSSGTPKWTVQMRAKGLLQRERPAAKGRQLTNEIHDNCKTVR